MDGALDIARVRRSFPALAGDWIYLDNAGGSQTLGAVADRVRDYLTGTNVQLGASYDVSRRSEERVRAGEAALARLLGAADRTESVVGPSTSALLRMLAGTLGRTFAAGDEVVVTNCDHEANIGPWRDLERDGIVVRTWRVNPDSLRLESEDLEALLGPRTRLVAVTHASNVLGQVNPVSRWARIVHEHGARICVDGVAYAPHRRIDVAAWDVDFYTVSLYKVYGPHLAVMFGKRDLLRALPACNHFFLADDDVPYRLQPGGPNYELTYAAGAVPEYLEELGGGSLDAAFTQIAAHEHALGARLLDWLSGKRGVRVIGPARMTEDRVPTVSFTVEGKRSSEIPPRTDAERIGIRWGDFYARRLVDDLDLAEQDGVVRVSLVHYNTLEEVDRLIAALDPWI